MVSRTLKEIGHGNLKSLLRSRILPAGIALCVMFILFILRVWSEDPPLGKQASLNVGSDFPAVGCLTSMK